MTTSNPNPTTTTNTATCQIDGVTYEIVSRMTVEDQVEAGRHRLAREMETLKQAAHLYLRRPKGSVMYFAVEGVSGRVSSNPVSLGRWGRE